jgi:NADH-quinone oxidoreductase subunit N
MNWTLALPELVLSIVGMMILVFGVLRKGDNAFLASMFTIGGFVLAAFLVVSGSNGSGFHGQFVVDPFS